MNAYSKQNNLPCNQTLDGCSFQFVDYRAHETFTIYHATMNQIIYCKKGSVRISSNLFKEEIISERQLVFLPRTSDYRGEATEDTHLIVHLFNHTVCRPEECILNYLYTHRKRQDPDVQFQCRLDSFQGIRTFMESITNYLTDGTGDIFLWNLKHKELIRMLCRYYPPVTLQSFFHPLTDEDVPFKSLVMSHYQQAKTAKELAEICGYGLYTFCRIFKKEFAVSAYQWLIKKRSEHILHKLSLPYIPFSDIINEFNFSSSAHFCHFCKKFLGNTPSKLRNAITNSYKKK